MSHYHCVAWVDHHEARIIQFNADAANTTIVRSRAAHPHLHRKHGAVGSGNVAEDTHFFKEIADVLGRSHEILIVGPSDAKLALRDYLRRAAPVVASCVAAVEPADHPSDGELLKFARHFFVPVDRMLPQS